MSGVNKAIIVGHLGRDPDVRRTQEGRAVASFSVATSENWRDKTTGERKERTEWHRVVVFNENLAKVAEQYLKKGAKVYVEGKIQTRKWTDQSGAERYTTEIVLDAFHAQLKMLDRREGVPPAQSPDDYGTGDVRPAVPAAAPPASARAGEAMNDEIPF